MPNWRGLTGIKEKELQKEVRFSPRLKLSRRGERKKKKKFHHE